MTNFLKARWENIIMANYAVPPEVLAPYLPHGVELDYFEGQTFVSLVGFMFKDTRIFNVPIPYFGSFEEINLRFYVKQTSNGETKRGVVFINETIPYNIVALVANALYKEHYVTVPTKHFWQINENKKHIEYQWKKSGQWNKIMVKAGNSPLKMLPNSIESFIYEHYYGFTKINDNTTELYRIEHPSWKINSIKDYSIKCDFKAMYGPDFEFLNIRKPDSIMMAEGSEIAVKWKRERF